MPGSLETDTRAGPVCRPFRPVLGMAVAEAAPSERPAPSFPGPLGLVLD